MVLGSPDRVAEGNPSELLRRHGIRPSAQRLAVAASVLFTDAHPSADAVFEDARSRLPMLSRATVYNTLNLFVEKGLLRALDLGPGRMVFDPKVDRHHHFIDEGSGRIHDIPWTAITVARVESLGGFDVSDYQVVLRGRKHPEKARSNKRRH